MFSPPSPRARFCRISHFRKVTRGSSAGGLTYADVARRAAMTATLLAIVCVFMVGCAHDDVGRDVADAVEQWERTKVNASTNEAPLDDTAAVDCVATAGSTPPASTDAARADSLDGYVSEALERNPSIAAAIANVRAKLERIPQAKALADPILRTVSRPERIQTAAGDLTFTLGVTQTIPLPQKLDGKGRAAAAEAKMAIEQLNATRLSVIADVVRAYYRLYVTDRSLELAATHRKLLESLEQVVASQYRVGKVGQQDVLRVQTALTSLLNDEDTYARQRMSAAAALNRLLDRPLMSPVPETKAIALSGISERAEKLIALAREHNPEIAELLHQIDRDRESIALADLGYWPDLTLGFEWSHGKGRSPFIPQINPTTGQRPRYNRKSEEGDDNWAIIAQVNVPIWAEKIEASRREARAKLERTLKQRHATENMIAFRVYDAWVEAKTHEDTIRLLESTLLPQALQMYEVSLSEYQVGRSDFLRVIDDWRIRLNFELMRHREIAAFERAVADLEQAIGMQLVRGEASPNDFAKGNMDD